LHRSRIIALYKTWDGGEFVDASLASIYDYVDAIVMIHSETSWLGEKGNTVRPRAIKWCESNDNCSKVHHVTVDAISQEEQYAVGVDYIHKHFNYDVVMVVDADEVWEGQYIENAIRQIHAESFPVYRANMHTYLKTPFYRVDPPYGSPTVFFREPEHLTRSPRGCKAPSKMLSDVWMHHYTYVRESRELVERKIRQSCLADKSGESVVEGWMESVYDRLPLGANLHAFIRHTNKWQRVSKIWIDEVPKAVRESELISMWLPDGLLMDGERNCIYRMMRGRKLAVDLGTYTGLSATILGLACEDVHTYDCYEDLPSYEGTNEYRNWCGHKYGLEWNTAFAARHGNITVHKSDTVQAGHNWTLGRVVDGMFVDADHTYEATINTVYAWKPHLVPDALMMFHDNNEIHPGVMQAVNELKADNSLREVDCGQYSGSLAAFSVIG
jgi:hypothetical protein